MSNLAQPGDFCPNRDCDDYGKLQSERQQNIIKFGKTKAGRGAPAPRQRTGNSGEG